MLTLIVDRLTDGRFMLGLVAAVMAAAAALTIAMPLLETDTLAKRMKSVANERERIRQRERAAAANSKASLRQSERAFIKRISVALKLGSWLGTEGAKAKLAQAGYRSPGAENAFMVARLVMPFVFFAGTLFFVFVVHPLSYPPIVRFGIAVLGAYLGIKAPEIFLSNTIGKRKQSISRAYPNALDLLLICAESGMSIEQAFRKVSQEIGAESVALAEEFTLITAELSFLPERRQAYENVAARTGLESMRSLKTVLVQAERYGTPLGAALRVLAQESRDERMHLAEKKAAALSSKLTVPMIAFFLPVLLMVILGPALIRIFKWS
ncbi:MAG: type II secretion system F family protein [Hyphomicrobiales bacterium]|nr:type II secretion system F family protein [Hyphomicrobiales bacterium]MDE2017915.1 type II secretion system F family protein [Hyphomicrobiales bacterium]